MEDYIIEGLNIFSRNNVRAIEKSESKKNKFSDLNRFFIEHKKNEPRDSRKSFLNFLNFYSSLNEKEVVFFYEIINNALIYDFDLRHHLSISNNPSNLLLSDLNQEVPWTKALAIRTISFIYSLYITDECDLEYAVRETNIPLSYWRYFIANPENIALTIINIPEEKIKVQEKYKFFNNNEESFMKRFMERYFEGRIPEDIVTIYSILQKG